jgi:hypothetical protein
MALKAMMSSERQATVGKRVMSMWLPILGAGAFRLGAQPPTLREISFLLPARIGFIMAAFTSKKGRCVIASDTRVKDKRIRLYFISRVYDRWRFPAVAIVAPGSRCLTLACHPRPK